MRGRPIKSKIRQNILEMLKVKKKMYGYELYNHYIAIFPKVHMRSIYYHLKKGTSTKEIQMHEIKQKKGNYSWGQQAEKIYYSLGDKANPTMNPKVKEYFDTREKRSFSVSQKAEVSAKKKK